MDSVGLDGWFLTAEQRGNAATVLDSRHPDDAAWTLGNHVRPLVHGVDYFGELLTGVRAMRAGDHLFFTDWRGDPDERLGGAGTEVAQVLADAAARGVVVRGLMWRSHLDRFRYHQRENRLLGETVQAAGGECLLDMRVRAGGSAPLTRSPLRRSRDRILRTYPYRRRGYNFAPAGERSIARAYVKALGRARRLVYLEDQYVWSPHVVGVFAQALAASPELRMIAVVPQFPPRSTCTRRSASSTTCGRPSARTTSTCGRGPSIAN